MHRLKKIISGGQTGADRAALDWAIGAGLEHGGWCPRGRRAEDGTIDLACQLQETPSADYAQRTKWNVRDADGTVIFSIDPALTGGTLLTRKLARRLGKPCLHLHSEIVFEEAAERLRTFIVDHEIQTLNVAGPRASGEPEIGAFVADTLNSIARP